MKHLLINSATCVLTSLMLCSHSSAGEFTESISAESINDGGRNIMRTADGGIVASFSVSSDSNSHLVFSRSANNGRSWDSEFVKEIDGQVVQTAIDSNFQGSYIAFTEIKDGKTFGRIAYSSAPFGDDPQLSISGSVTPEGVVPTDTFIQASRAGWGERADKDRESVVYGWQDANTKNLYIGVSNDGQSFPNARLVVKDRYATSGPAVAIRGKYVVATYQTTNPDMAPNQVLQKEGTKRSYPAWLESMDGGETWSTPQPLFGKNLNDFPKITVENTAGISTEYQLAGGTELPNSPILNWASTRNLERSFILADKTLPSLQLPGNKLPTVERFGVVNPNPDLQEIRIKRNNSLGNKEDERDGLKKHDGMKKVSNLSLGGTTFVQTSMKSIGEEGPVGEISIVSFRPIEPEAEWTHVLANNPIVTRTNAEASESLSTPLRHGSQFQYSALIDTAVRATVYKETDPVSLDVRLVAAVSTDTGKTFNHHTSWTSKKMKEFGINIFDLDTTFSTSQCLFEDRNGEVYVDILVSNSDKLSFTSIPIGVNAAKLRDEG